MDSDKDKHDFRWVDEVLHELGAIPLPCLYHDPAAMFNLRGVQKPMKIALDHYLKAQIESGLVQVVNADGSIVLDYKSEIEKAGYVEPSKRVGFSRIEAIKQKTRQCRDQ